LVEKLLPFSQTELDLGLPPLEVKADRNQSKTLFLGFADQFFNLAAMKQEFSRPKRLVVEGPCVGIGADMAIQEKGLVVPDHGIGIGKIRLALAEGFDFGPQE